MTDGARYARLYDRRMVWSAVGLSISVVRGENCTSSMMSNLSTRAPTSSRTYLPRKISSWR